MRFKMGIKNYKSFKNRQNIDFASITIFVGPNSGGKSSILKLLGLFNQSFNSSTKQLLFNGVYTDLKDFKSITNNYNENPVEIDFITKEIYDPGENIPPSREINNNDIKFTIKISSNNLTTSYEKKGDNLKSSRQYLKDNTYIFSDVEKSNIKNRIQESIHQHRNALNELTGWNNKTTDKKLNQYTNIILRNCILGCNDLDSKLYAGCNGMVWQLDGIQPFVVTIGETLIALLEPPFKDLKEFIGKWSEFDEILSSSNINNYLTKNITHYYYFTKQDLGQRSSVNGINNENEIKAEKASIFNDKKDLFENILNIVDNKYRKLFISIIWYSLFSQIFDSWLEEVKNIQQKFQQIYRPTITSHFKNFKFLPPLREKPRRYYSKDELLVYLFGKSPISLWIEKRKYASTTVQDITNKVNKNLQLIGILSKVHIRKVDDRNLPDLYVIEIYDYNNKSYFNLQDVGYGYSQILPILFSLELNSSDYLSNLIIEQPELHLHPKFQTGLSSIIVKTISNNKYDDDVSTIIMETHSEHILREIQVQIAQGLLSNSDVAVNYVGKYKNGNSFVKRMELTKKGLFKDDWPGELFEDGYQQSLELLKHQ
jgi:predicted ATPase